MHCDPQDPLTNGTPDRKSGDRRPRCGRARRAEAVAEATLHAAALVSAAALLAILGFLVYFAWPLFTREGLTRILAAEWRPFQDRYGILTMVAGSLAVAGLAMAVAFPAALGVAAFTRGLGPRCLGRFVLAVVRFMTCIPTIVYAFVAATVLPPFFRDVLATGSGFSLLTAGLVLALLVLPTVVLLLHSLWHGTAEPVLRTAYALGLTRGQAFWHVLLPVSGRGLTLAFLLGLARALGDTMIALLLAGNAPEWPGSLLESVRTLTAHIALVLATDSQTPIYHSVFAAGLILLLVNGLMSLGARRLRRRAATPSSAPSSAPGKASRP